MVLQLWEIGFTTADDTAMSQMLPGDIWALIQNNWSDPSIRGSYIPSLFLNYLRSLFPATQVYFRSITILPILLEIFLFGYLVQTTLKIKQIGIISSILAVAAFQHNWHHHSLTAFIFNLHFGFSLTLLSFIFFMKFFKNQKFKYLLISSLCFSLSISIYELFIAYLAVFPILYYIQPYSINFTKSSIFKMILAFDVLVICTILFIFKFFYFQDFNPDYQGTALVKEFSLYKIIKSDFIFSTSALPGTVFQKSKDLIREIYGVEGKYFEFLTFFPKMRFVWLFTPIAFSILIFRLYKNSINPYIPKKQWLVYFSLAISLLFLPNILLSLSETHQQRALGTEKFYSGTHFSSFGWVFLLIITCISIKNLFGRNSKAVISIILVYSFVQGYRNQISNSAISNVQSLHYANWKLLEDFYNEGYLKKNNPEKVIYWSKGMLGEPTKFFGIFHPNEERWMLWKYWYNFTQNAFGEHLPIFSDLPSCERVLNNCRDRNSQYQLEFKIHHQNRLATLTLCEISMTKQIPTLSNCVQKKTRAYF